MGERIEFTDEKNTLEVKQDFLGGAVVKNLPANAGDMGSSSGPGRFHVSQSNYAHASQLLSLRATTTEPTCHNY